MEYIKKYESWVNYKGQVQKRKDYIILSRKQDYNINNFLGRETDYFLQFLEVERYDEYGFYGFIIYMIGDPDNWDNDYRNNVYMGQLGSDGVPHYFSERMDNLEILFKSSKRKVAEEYLEKLKKESPYSEWIEEWDLKDTSKRYNL